MKIKIGEVMSNLKRILYENQIAFNHFSLKLTPRVVKSTGQKKNSRTTPKRLASASPSSQELTFFIFLKADKRIRQVGIRSCRFDAQPNPTYKIYEQLMVATLGIAPTSAQSTQVEQAGSKICLVQKLEQRSSHASVF